MGDRLGTPGAVGFWAKFPVISDWISSNLSLEPGIINVCSVHAGMHAQNMPKRANDVECS